MTVSPNRTAPLSTLGARPGLGLGLKFGLLATAAATCLVAVLTISQPLRAQDANAVIAKVNGAEIRQSELTVAEEELGPSLQQMDPATRRDNLISFLIDMKIVAKAAEGGLALHELPLLEMQAIEPKITREVLGVLSVESSVKSRTSFGGTAPKVSLTIRSNSSSGSAATKQTERRLVL